MLQFQIGGQMITRVASAILLDSQGNKKEVRPGDKVELLPIPQNIDKESREVELRHQRFMERFLEGKGPYTISWIGQWPCGRKNLYFKIGTEGREPGAHAHDFIPAK